MRKGLLCTVMAFSICILSSCWSSKELTDLAIVAAMGIDKTKDGQYQITLQIINPGNVAGGLQGGGVVPKVRLFPYTEQKAQT